MPRLRGMTHPLSLSRRMIGDFLQAGRHASVVSVERDMTLGELRDAREESSLRPPWPVIFVKALGLAARRCPDVRRTLLRWPTRRIYEHPVPVGSIVIEKNINGEDFLFNLPLENPGAASLAELAVAVRRAKQLPPSKTRSFRRALRYGRFPWPVRKVLWNLLDWSGPLRAEFFGTFGISSTAGLGASALYLVSPWTTAVCYSPFRPDGSMSVRLTFDHYVLDGAAACRILAETESALTGPVLQELRENVGATTG